MIRHTPSSSPTLPAVPDRGRINSRDLFMGQQEILIEHEGQIYRLRITRQGKLILTK